MNIFFCIAGGILAGIIAGMGMGGGTLLIPVLTLLAGLGQHSAQGINTIAFIPSAIAAILIHKKADRIKFKECIPIVIWGLVFAALGAFLALRLDGKILRYSFAGFLAILSVRQFITGERQKREKDISKKK